MKIIKKYLEVCLGCFLCAFAYVVFFKPYNIVPGGVTGVSMILSKYYQFTDYIFILFVSIITLVIGFVFLGYKDVHRSILGTFLYPLFIPLIVFIIDKTGINLEIENAILATTFGSFVFGYGLGLSLKHNFSSGGTSILNKLISKIFNLTYGEGSMIINLIVVIIGGIVFGINTFLYSIFEIIITGFLVDKVNLGISKSKSFYIITKKEDEVKEYITKELVHGVTIINAKGGYTGEKKHILLTAIPTTEYYKLRANVKRIDPEAFIIVNDNYSVRGVRNV